MIKNNYSSLLTIRPSQCSASKIEWILWDPEKDNNSTISSKNLINLENINQIIDQIKKGMKNTESLLYDKYLFWLQRGWHKSLDYYVASKNKNFLSNFAEKNEEKFRREFFNPNFISLKESLTIPQALVKRKTRRAFQNKMLDEKIFYSGLETALMRSREELRALEIYFIIYKVQNIEPGVYWYNLDKKLMRRVRSGHFANEMSKNLQGMRAPQSACFSAILVSNFIKFQSLFPYAKGLRDAYIESGRLAQKILISYMQYELFSLVTPALCDKSMAYLLKLEEPDFYPVYSLTLGP